MHALTRNTCSMTMLEASNKINVVPRSHDPLRSSG